jgi:hypothetical protein
MIPTAIFRAFPANTWTTVPASTLAEAVVQPGGLRSMSLMALFQTAAAAGANVTEFRAIWQYAEFVQRTETALQTGDLPGATALLAVCPVQFSAATQQALQTVLAVNMLRLIDLVAAEQQPPVSAPAQVSATDVTLALNALGYTWDGQAWQI